MDDNKFVIIGANGQLGRALQEKYANAQAVDREELDITDYEAVMAFDWSGLTHILNAAAYTNVDGAETLEGRKASWLINATGAANLAQAANKFNLTLVHISTDYVFDGSEDSYPEDAPFSPLSVYGASKAAGDTVASLVPSHYILRTSWVVGDGKNFVRTMMSLAEKNISPTVVNDQVGRLTFTDELVRAIDHLLATNVPYGVYNLTNEGRPASWADITRVIFAELDRDDLTVTDTTTADYYAGKKNVAPRPLRSTLDLSKIRGCGFTPNDWRDDLKKYIQEQQ